MNIINKIRKYFKKNAKEEYLKRHGMTHACSSCGKWEHEGNYLITNTVDSRFGDVVRHCVSCGYTFYSIFTPAGFIDVGETSIKNVINDNPKLTECDIRGLP